MNWPKVGKALKYTAYALGLYIFVMLFAQAIMETGQHPGKAYIPTNLKGHGAPE